LRASKLDEKGASKTFGILDNIDFFVEKWLEMGKNNARINGFTLRLSENAHLPAETAGSKELRLSADYPHPSSLQRTSMYASRRYRSLAVIPRDFGALPSRPAPEAGSTTSRIYDRAGFRKAQLAYGHFPSASEVMAFSTVTL
jgi:hypothetical protein